MKCILGRKVEMTRVFDSLGNAIPVTIVAVKKNIITQIKTQENDGVNSIQIGTKGKSKHLNLAQLGHIKDEKAVTYMREFRNRDAESYECGDRWGSNVFVEGEKVSVTGIVKGRGFQGVVKRHGFHGSPASHGHKDQLRMPGSIANRRQGPVAKGKRMGGHMGGNQVTVHGLSVVKIDSELDMLYIKGAIPGSRGSFVKIVGSGEMKVEKKIVESKEEVLPVEDVVETVSHNSEVVTSNVVDSVIDNVIAHELN